MENFTDNLIKDYMPIVSAEGINVAKINERVNSKGHYCIWGDAYNIAADIMQYVIDHSYKKAAPGDNYGKKDYRLQLFINADREENHVKNVCNFEDGPHHRSEMIIMKDGAEKGADLLGPNGELIECKIYGDSDKAEKYINDDPKVFHTGTTHVCIYIKNTKEWRFCKRMPNGTFVYTNEMDQYIKLLSKTTLKLVYVKEGLNRYDGKPQFQINLSKF